MLCGKIEVIDWTIVYYIGPDNQGTTFVAS